MLPGLVIEEGYWREPLDPTIAMTQKGRFYKHFHQLVCPAPDSTAPGVSFHQYIELPAELQLRVLELCEAPTLFQLMHTSRHLRTEAKKLFFSNQKTWYYLSADSLLEGCPAESIYDIEFLACVEQLDLECSGATEDCLTGRMRDMAYWAEVQLEFDEKDFWQIVRRLFPRVKRVILSQESRSPLDKDPVACCYQKLAQACPQDIDVSICATETEEDAVGRRRKRVCWRLRAGQEDVDAGTTLERDELLKSPLMPVVPPQKACRGRVGKFLRSAALWNKLNGQCFAVPMHRAAAVEKHYFEKQYEPFSCSLTNCDAWFEQPDQYTTHLLATRHGKEEEAPGQFETVFTENSKRLERLKNDHREAQCRFWDWWGTEDDAETLSMAKKEVMDQLEHDALYMQNKPIAEHGLWRMILQTAFWREYN